MTDDEAALAQALDWLAAGRRVALATVVGTWGSSPRPIGSLLVATDDGAFAGSVSGGCIEGAVIQACGTAMRSGRPALLPFGVGDDVARAADLACGGTLEVFVEPVDDAAALRPLRDDRPLLRLVDLDSGAATLLRGADLHGTAALGPETRAAVDAALADGRSRRIAADGRDLFLAVFAAPIRLIIVGAVHIAQVLSALAHAAGFRVLVIDPRDGFAAADRFPAVTMSRDWPDDALRDAPPDARSAVVTLSHDPRLDDPALIAALRSAAFYIGALGSARTHARRVQRLRGAGFTDSALARIHGPVGLDLGGRTVPEIAVAILAEIIAVRHGRQIGGARNGAPHSGVE